MISAYKVMAKAAYEEAHTDYSRIKCTVLKFCITSSKTLSQNSVCLDLQLMEQEIAGRNTLVLSTLTKPQYVLNFLT